MVSIKILPISVNIYSNQTGRFPVTSIMGGRYTMVTEEYESDNILEEPLTSRSETEILHAVTKLYHHLKFHGIKPLLYMLDNVCSSLMEVLSGKRGLHTN